MSEFKFKCSCCGEVHKGIPTFGTDYPVTVLQIPLEERDYRVDLGSDECVIDEKYFYIRGCIEIPVHGYDELFVWGSWVSVSKDSFLTFIKNYDEEKRSQIEPFFGWHCSDFIAYDEACISLKTRVYLRDNGIRPYIELEPTAHPLAAEQREGISEERLIKIFEIMMHGKQ